MTLEIQSQRIDKTKNLDNEFSEEQLELLKEDHEQKYANEKMNNFNESMMIQHYRKKYHVSRRDALDIISRTN